MSTQLYTNTEYALLKFHYEGNVEFTITSDMAVLSIAVTYFPISLGSRGMATSFRQSWVRDVTEESTSGVLQQQTRHNNNKLAKGLPHHAH